MTGGTRENGDGLEVALIVAMAENRVIGRDGGMPWHLPDDLKHFKRVTMGKPIVMGRRTYESIGRPLPGRLNVVVTRERGLEIAGCAVAHDLADALAIARTEARAKGASEVMVIGGATLYEQALASADRIYLTRIAASVDGDVRMPRFEESDWMCKEREAHEADGRHEHAFTFEIWERRPPT